MIWEKQGTLTDQGSEIMEVLHHLWSGKGKVLSGCKRIQNAKDPGGLVVQKSKILKKLIRYSGGLGAQGTRYPGNLRKLVFTLIIYLCV